jgi:hypothetical protein
MYSVRTSPSWMTTDAISALVRLGSMVDARRMV